MALQPGDQVRLKNTHSGDQHYNPDERWKEMFPKSHTDGKFDGLTGVVTKGPYNKKEYGEIPIYQIRLEDGQRAECTWSALEKIGELDHEYFEAILKWEQQLNE